MTPTPQNTTWDFSPAIDLLRTLSASKAPPPLWSPSPTESTSRNSQQDESSSLGNFEKIFDFIRQDREKSSSLVYKRQSPGLNGPGDVDNNGSLSEELVHNGDSILSSNLLVGSEKSSGDVLSGPAKPELSHKRQKPTKQKTRTTLELRKENLGANAAQDSTTEPESENELERLRRSPDRTVVIRSMLGPLSGKAPGTSPPSSPSPSKSASLTILKRVELVSDPFHSRLSDFKAGKQPQIVAIDGLDARRRKLKLIASLFHNFPGQSLGMLNEGILDPSFLSSNTDNAGIHVFVDISNIMIGFHDCLKSARGIPITDRVRRLPMSFHNFAIILERGRPAAKRVLVGSDRYEAIDEAKILGYETNILERVHKAKEPAPRGKRFRTDHTALGASSGSETILRRPAPEKWVEQAVDEILHLKILESIIDAEKPATMVLATGDAAEAEYSAGFLKMVERALQKGWTVELVSFKLNTSGLYKRKEFRARWGAMFQWILLDSYVEQLLDEA